jgi:predicted O-methyltransferase YrrM
MESDNKRGWFMNLSEVAKAVGDNPYMAQQKYTELESLLKLLQSIKPKKILEIGVFKGGTIMAWTYIADNNAKIVGVDLPDGGFGGGFTPEEANTIRKLAKQNQTIELKAMDSHDPKTINKIKDIAPFDFIFIDGDHTYMGAKEDFLNYYPMLNKGGILALHDIVDHDRADVGVHLLWAEIKEKYKTNEFIDLDFPTDSGVWGGIGVVFND